jgi:hypothetical protein
MISQCDYVIRELAALLNRTIDGENFQSHQQPASDEYEAFDVIDRHTIVNGRSFCVTETGRFCNAMNQARERDGIAAFQGSDRLWILRPVGERYRLIGEVYVDGLMKGEAYEGVDPDEVDHDIELV